MRKMLFLFLLFSANVVFSQTTQDEYNYATKGLKIQLENGLDMKAGYELYEAARFDSPNKGFVIYKMFRKETQQLACLIVVQKVEDEFFCIPHPKSDNTIISNAFFRLNGVLGAESLTTVIFALNQLTKWD